MSFAERKVRIGWYWRKIEKMLNLCKHFMEHYMIGVGNIENLIDSEGKVEASAIQIWNGEDLEIVDSEAH